MEQIASPENHSQQTPPPIVAAGPGGPSELEDIRTLLWGTQISDTVFTRWSQGFDFSEVEPSALVQYQGGPCAVIAPVQAFLLQAYLEDCSASGGTACTFSEVPKEKCKALLVQAITNILTKCKSPEQCYRLVSVDHQHHPQQLVHTNTGLDSQVLSPSKIIEETSAPAYATSPDAPLSPAPVPTPPAEVAVEAATEEADYHSRLTVTVVERPEQVVHFYTQNYTVLSDQFGVLLLLYSVVLTRGVEAVKAELNDISEPLIDNTYGYGSQSLINLMLTGSATAHVFDNFEDVGGMKLQGLSQQSEIGFITLMEQLRYCTVGSFFKNPKSPVWVMGSETHLSVLFSDEPKLVSPETASEKAKRVFKSYDPDGNNFIQCDALQEILRTLDLVSEDEYVEIMKQKLDPEKLGIILLNAFMDEFFPEERRSVPDVFRLWHYNGIPGSNEGHQVKYNAGSAVLLETDLGQMINSSNPMLMCLQTKWPLIEVKWCARTPSLN